MSVIEKQVRKQGAKSTDSILDFATAASLGEARIGRIISKQSDPEYDGQRAEYRQGSFAQRLDDLLRVAR